MKRKDISSAAILCLMLLPAALNAQGLTIGPGTEFTLGSSTLSLSGNWSNSGLFNAGSGTVVFNTPSGNQTITNSSGETFNNIIVNKASGNLQLMNDVTLNGTLTLTSGKLVTGDANKVILGNSATVSESAGKNIEGTVQSTKSVGTSSVNNWAGLGVTVSAGADDAGQATLTRITGTKGIQTHNSKSGIACTWQITAQNAMPGGRSLTLSWLSDYDNSKNLTAMRIWGSADGTNWLDASLADANASSRTIGGFYIAPAAGTGYFTVSDNSNPLPVELSSFSISQSDAGIKLVWSTATEVNNYGFEVERRRDGVTGRLGDLEKIGFVNGHGNSNAAHEYSFTDGNAPSGNLQYRLKQIDNDGYYKYYDAVSISVDKPKGFKLLQNSPNPFNPVTAIKFSMPENSVAAIKVYDQLGREVATLLNEERPAGSHIVYWNGKDNNGQSVSSGVYLYSLRAGAHIETKKMNLLK